MSAGPEASGSEPAGIVTLTLSPALDLTLTSEQLEPGTSQRIAPATARLGGKGINVARVLAELGCDVCIQGPAASEEQVRHERAGHEADSDRADADGLTGDEPAGHGRLIWDLTDTESPLRRSYAIVEDSGRATVLNEHAHAQSAEVWAALEAGILRRVSEPEVRVLVVSGSTPTDLPAGFHDRVIAAAHDEDVIVIVDTSGPGLHLAARAGADWVKPNREELAELAELTELAENAGLAVRPDSDPATGAGELIRTGAGTALVSLGTEGMVIVDGTGVRLRAHLDRVLNGNPTGAGDAAVAALARWLADREPAGTERLRDDEVESLLTEAVAISAAAVLMPQAGEIHPSWRRLCADVVLGSPTSPSAASPPTDTLPAPPPPPTEPSTHTHTPPRKDRA